MDIQLLFMQLYRLHKRIKKLEKKAARLEAACEQFRHMQRLQKQLLALKLEIEKMKRTPDQIMIGHLQNNIGQIDVATLEGLLNVGVAANHLGCSDDGHLNIGSQSIADLLKSEQAAQADEETNEAAENKDKGATDEKEAGEEDDEQL